MSILNIGKKLNREEQKQINGGVTYCWLDPYFPCCGECISGLCSEPCEPL